MKNRFGRGCLPSLHLAVTGFGWQQFSAVRKALDSTYLRMTLCFMEQELHACIKPDETQQAGLDLMLKNMETLLARMG